MNQKAMENATRHRSDGHSRPTISIWLERRCHSDGLSLRKAAALIGVSHNTIASIINGERPSPATVVKLAKAFSGNGHHEREGLEDFLLNLAGYRSERRDEEFNEPLTRVIDKLVRFNTDQLKVVEQFADFILKIGSEECEK